MELNLHHQLKERLTHLWLPWFGANILISGGTGFFGKWLLESHLWLVEAGLSEAQLTLVSRNPAGFLRQHPKFQHPRIRLIQADVRERVPLDQKFDLVIHGATEASAKLNREDPLLMMDVILQGTRNFLEAAVSAQAKRFLMLSSGAVYGEQPKDLEGLRETYPGAPDPTQVLTAYGNAKRTAELLSFIYANQGEMETVVARGFAFVGPYLPLDGEFAVGNFMSNALKNQPIVIKGNGQPVRSYLYGEDLAIWLWTLLLEGQAGECYNLGSDQGVSVLELAKTVQAVAPNPITIEGPLAPSGAEFRNRYLPNIDKAKALGLKVWTPLEAGLRKTLLWHSA